VHSIRNPALLLSRMPDRFQVNQALAHTLGKSTTMMITLDLS
jgi:hypothetical protein